MIWRSGLSHKKPASSLEVMGFVFYFSFAFLIIEEEGGLDLLECSPYHLPSLCAQGEEQLRVERGKILTIVLSLR